MKRHSICDICGKDSVLGIEQNLFKRGNYGRTDTWDTCLNCTILLSNYAKRLKKEMKPR